MGSRYQGQPGRFLPKQTLRSYPGPAASGFSPGGLRNVHFLDVSPGNSDVF